MKNVWAGVVACAVALTGISSASAIIGGTDVPCNERRFDAVGKVYKIQENGFHELRGSCTLIAPDLVVTARHVASDGPATSPVYTTGQSKIVFRRAANGALSDQEVDVLQTYEIYYNIAGSTGPYDVVLIRLATPVSYIRPMKVDFSPVPEGELFGFTSMTFCGWGCTNIPSGSCVGANVLRVRENVASEGLYYPSLGTYDPSIYADNAYGILTQSGVAVCGQYDSGSPILREYCTSTGTTQYAITGVISVPSGGTSLDVWNSHIPSGMGYPVLTSAQPSCTPCLADVTANGHVNSTDSSSFASNYTAGTCVADLNKDGVVNSADLSLFLSLIVAQTTSPDCNQGL